MTPKAHIPLCSRWLPNTSENDRNNMNLHGQRENFASWTQHHLYSTCSRWGLALGVGIGGNANVCVRVGGNANFSVFRYQQVGIGNASQWNIGLIHWLNGDCRRLERDCNVE